MRIPLNKSASQQRADKLEERMAVIEHGLLFELEGVLTDRELEDWDLKALRSRLATLHQVAKEALR
jgi:hypothetical protein